MSLKAFHIVFVAASVLLAFGFAAWGFVNFADDKNALNLLWGGIGIGTGVGLLFYGRFVLRKLKDFPYL
jgi:NO-binding membrane sensor protein with MHYT domain